MYLGVEPKLKPDLANSKESLSKVAEFSNTFEVSNIPIKVIEPHNKTRVLLSAGFKAWEKISLITLSSSCPEKISSL